MVTDPKTALRALWAAKGVSPERQAEILAEITAKTQPGAQVGPWTIPDRKPRGLSASTARGPCSCGICGRNILPGDRFTILDGEFYLAGHESREMDMVTGPRDLSRVTVRPAVAQRPVTDLPIFSREPAVEQLAMGF